MAISTLTSDNEMNKMAQFWHCADLAFVFPIVIRGHRSGNGEGEINRIKRRERSHKSSREQRGRDREPDAG